MKNLAKTFIAIVSLSFCWSKAQSQVPAKKVLMDVNYNNNQLTSGVKGVEATHASAKDAAYLVSPGAGGKGHAIAHKVVYGDTAYISNGAVRSEADALHFLPGRFTPGDERRYEFSVLLKEWTPWKQGDTINETNIYQLKLTAGEVPLQVRIKRNAVNLRFAKANNTPVVEILKDFRPFAGEWIHFRVDVLWSTSDTGYMKTYLKLPGQNEYSLVDSKTNYLTYPSNGKAGQIGYVKWGIYNGKNYLSRIIYHDDIRIIDLKKEQ